jgi:hypothetical protein
MRYSFYLPTRGDTAAPDALATLVSKAEGWGFTSVMIADHIVFPTVIESKYPYTVTGAFPGQGDALEQLTLMSFIAGKTERLRLVSSVMILPYRNPVLTAKILATIDVLSGGRVTVGAGVGWLEEEFESAAAARSATSGCASSRSCGRRIRSSMPASSTASARCTVSRSPCSGRIRPSGSAATASRRCAAPRATATVGIRSAPPPRCRWSRTTCAPSSTSCAG